MSAVRRVVSCRSLRAGLVVAATVACGCADRAARFDRALVSNALEEASGHALGAPPPVEDGATRDAAEAGLAAVPDGVALEDGISEEDAVAIALWRNPGFQEALAALGLARADVVEAGLLANPVLSVLFPVGPKQLEFAALLPLDAVLFRPRRLEVAELDGERIAALLVENGLDLIERVKRAHADLRLTRARATLAAELAAVREEVAEFEAVRLRAGDASELEVGLARVEAATARQQASRASRDELIARERLRDLLGLGEDPRELAFTWTDDVRAGERAAALEGIAAEAVGDGSALRTLVETALAARPDVRAAELGIEAAEARAGLARWSFLSFSGGVDANEEGKSDFEIGPALDVEIPVFDRGQGATARAAAELERAARGYVAVRNRVVLEVKEARARWAQAVEELDGWRSRVLPGLEETLRAAETRERLGEASRRPALEMRARVLEARRREAELVAELHGARAGLERSIGRRLGELRARDAGESGGGG